MRTLFTLCLVIATPVTAAAQAEVRSVAGMIVKYYSPTQSSMIDMSCNPAGEGWSCRGIETLVEPPRVRRDVTGAVVHEAARVRQ
ncbi:MAG TPA: hypothetical protein VF904_08275, partial [Anaeromyxobacteraceae bacterium]